MTTSQIPTIVRDTSNEILYTVRLESTSKRFVLWLVRGDFKAQIGHIPFDAFELKFLNKRSEALFDKACLQRIKKFWQKDSKGVHKLATGDHLITNVGTLSLELMITRVSEGPVPYNNVHVRLDEKTPIATWSHTNGVTFDKSAPSLFMKDKAWIAYECMNCMSEHGKGIFQ